MTIELNDLVHTETRKDAALRSLASHVLSRATSLLEKLNVPPRIVVERLLCFATSTLVAHLGKDGTREALETLILELDEGAFDDFVGRRRNAH